jgi:glycosyltransferase involved in cell wall biosynthesis
MNDRERIAELEAKVDQLERDEELSRLRLRDAAAAAKVQSNQIARLREEIERLRGRRSVGFALSASARIRPFASALSGLMAIWRGVARSGDPRSRRRRAPAVTSGGSNDAEGFGVATPRAVGGGGPVTFRDHLLAALDDRDRSTANPLHIAIAAVDGAPAVGEDLEKLGWRITRLDATGDGRTGPDASIDVVLVLDHDLDVRHLPRSVVTVAWLGDDAADWLGRPWFDEFDVVISSSGATADQVRRDSAKVATRVDPGGRPAPAIRSALTTWASSTRFGLLVGISDWEVAESWGDYHFARALQRSLERAGHPTRLHFQPDWSDAVTARDDVAVHLFGLREADLRPSQINLLWQISHPDRATAELYDRYDHVFVASDRFAARMAPLAHVPVTALHQATDPERFWPDPTGPAHELLFVGNSRNVRRRIIDDLADTPHELAVYGRRWRADLIDPRFVKGERIPNVDLRRYYSSADIVLNDHWDDMRAEGFLSNRLYDALACGAFVISDHVVGIGAEFDDAVVTYRDRVDLAALIERYLGDEDERHERGRRGRAAVLERHTFDARAQVLVAAVEAIRQSRQSADRPLP